MTVQVPVTELRTINTCKLICRFSVKPGDSSIVQKMQASVFSNIITQGIMRSGQLVYMMSS